MDSKLVYSIHPLVFINIADHLSRDQFQQSNTSGVVYGALLGTQSGRELEIFTSFEAKLLPGANHDLKLDIELFTTRKAQYKQVFPLYDLLGWYSTSTVPPGQQALDLHQQLAPLSDSLFYARLNPKALALKKLPLTIYEPFLHPNTGDLQFFEVSTIKIVTSEVERIAVDAVAKVQSQTSGPESHLIASLRTQRNAIEMLNNKILTLLCWVEKVQQDEIPVDFSILRNIYSVVQQVPTLTVTSFNEQFSDDYDDVLLCEYLSILTKATHLTNELVGRYQSLSAAQANVDRGSRKYRTGFASMKNTF